jgi:sugar phosphate isomerase/epimerase
MIRVGISSVCYRNAKAETIIASTRAAGLGGIEWSADTHAPHGDVQRAETLMMATLRAGLTISAYGSFFRLGMNIDQAASFDGVLQSARRLQAPVIRIWASTDPARRNSLRKKITPPGIVGKEASPQAVAAGKLVDQARALADIVGKYGITLCLEPHVSSLVPDYTSLESLVIGTAHPFFKACWTPLNTLETDSVHASVDRMSPLTSLVHFRAGRLLWECESVDLESPCLAMLDVLVEKERGSNLDRWALIEYLEDDSPQTLEKHARCMLDRIQPGKRPAAT